jgi:hypothetical protein
MKFFLTFGNIFFKNSLKRIYKEAQNFNVFDIIQILDNKILEERAPIFWNKHKDFILSNPRGYGFWLWKPFIILKTLENMKENDLLVYVDAGCTLNLNGFNRLNDYFTIVEKSISGILTFESFFLEKQYTKMDLFNFINLNDYNLLNSKQIIATAIIFRKCTNSVNFVKEWYEICCNYNLINDSNSIFKNDISFIEHRHDQSVFSLLAKKYKLEVLPDETYFENFNINGKNYPIWSTRLK